MNQSDRLIVASMLAISVLSICRGASCPIECSSCVFDPVTAELTSVTCAGYSPDRLDTSVQMALLSDLVLRDPNLAKFLFVGKVNLEYLQLNNSGIEALTSDVFDDAGGLTKLDLGMNKLTNITTSTFASVPGLKELILDNNKIDRVDDSAFAGMTQLQKLNLAHNDLTDLTLDMFFGLRSLLQLDLSYNSIETINTDALSRVSSMKSLDLSGNHILELANRQFSALPSLSRLMLSDNQISAVANSAFLDTAITYADMSSNRLSTIPIASLDILTSTLRTLKLADNNISVLLQNQLNRYTLDLLDLGNNAIRTLDVSAFVDASIDIIHLENNELNAMPFEIEGFLQTSAEVYLSGNPWSCECDNLWLLQAVRDNPTKYPSYQGAAPSCSSASGYPDMQLQTVAGQLEVDCLTTTTIQTTPTIECPYLCSKCETDPETGSIVKVTCTGISPRQVPNTVKEMILSQHQLRGGELGSIALEGKHLLESVVLKDFGIERITSDVFSGNTGLRVLHLEGNNLPTLSAAMFTSVSSLQQLRLVNNNISSVPDDVFANLGGLQFLSLASNQLIGLPDNALRRLSSLQFLDMSNNQLTRVSSAGLLVVPTLTALILNNNNIASLFTGEFSSLRNLQTLFISFNSITSVASNAFSGTSLVDLDVSENRLSMISTFVQDISSTLQRLRLNRNQIQTISSGTFAGANLELLDISNNSLTYFNAVDIGKPSINVTDLSHNDIDLITPDSVSFLDAGSHIYLSGNPWRCDCDTLWLVQTVRDNPAKYYSENGEAPMSPVCQNIRTWNYKESLNAWRVSARPPPRSLQRKP